MPLVETLTHDREEEIDSYGDRCYFSLCENRVTQQCQGCKRWACDTHMKTGGPFCWACAD